MKVLFYVYISLLLLIISTNTLAASNTPERVLWDSRPIQVHIQLNHERIIHFPEAVRYWLPDSIQNKVSIISANGVLYIRALEPFPSTRMRVQSLEDEQIYLLDVVVNDTTSVSDELIVMTAESIINRNDNHQIDTPEDDWRIRLTRYAAQQLYAPERLLLGDSGIQRIPMGIEQSIPLIRTGIIDSVPLASWRGGGFTVTAIKIRNLQEHPVTLAFEQSESIHRINLSHLIRGTWLTITLQHNTMGRVGSDYDSTTLYLVSKDSFAESLGTVLQTISSTGDNSNG